MITYEDFKKVEIRLGEVLSAERVPETDKLLRLTVTFGEEEPRQIISGIAEHVDPEHVVGKKFPFVTNLEPRVIRGLESNGMILGVSAQEGAFALLEPTHDVVAGSYIG